MKLTIFNLKGGQGKTTLSLALALEYGYYIVTNDQYSPIEKVLPKKKVKHLAVDSPLPSVPEDLDLIYDFGGYADRRLIAAVTQSDWVIVPIVYDSPLDMQTTIKSIKEIEKHNDKIIIVVNRAKKGIKNKAESVLRTFFNYPTLELRNSTCFVKIVENKIALSEQIKSSPLLSYHYKPVLKQLSDIQKLINKE